MMLHHAENIVILQANAVLQSKHVKELSSVVCYTALL